MPTRATRGTSAQKGERVTTQKQMLVLIIFVGGKVTRGKNFRTSFEYVSSLPMIGADSLPFPLSAFLAAAVARSEKNVDLRVVIDGAAVVVVAEVVVVLAAAEAAA